MYEARWEYCSLIWFRCGGGLTVIQTLKSKRVLTLRNYTAQGVQDRVLFQEEAEIEVLPNNDREREEFHKASQLMQTSFENVLTVALANLGASGWEIIKGDPVDASKMMPSFQSEVDSGSIFFKRKWIIEK